MAKCDANGGCSCVLIFRNYHTDDDYKPFDVASYTDGAQSINPLCTCSTIDDGDS